MSLSLDDFQYELPVELIAQTPAACREESRLMVVDRRSGTINHVLFTDLAERLPQGGLIVINDAKVVPVRLFGRRESGGLVEVVIMEPPPPDAPPGSYWLECLVKPAKRIKNGEVIRFGPDITGEMIRPGREGHRVLKFNFDGSPLEVLEARGRMPLPPYIKRNPENDERAELDRQRYQTVYASSSGAVAAPTAGLHFGPKTLEVLGASGFEIVPLTLLVGYGTFAPVRETDITSHRMHPERVRIPDETATAVNRAKAEGRPVIAVGTTVVRSLEHSARVSGTGAGPVTPMEEETRLFIHPGFKFKVVDHLITNFHLPGSTLVMLVAALAGLDFILEAYRLAVAERYRFFSYGDAMLII